jgi:glyoxylase-like metal-dependent hydrolase (beta-lactamase superfamily II)
MLIDAGLGDKNDERFNELYGVNRSQSLDHALAEAGLSAADIDIVLATHLHFDQAGGFTVRDAAGTVRPRFPRARYVVRRGEWDEATHLSDRAAGSYRTDDYLPLVDAGVLELVDEDQTIMPGVKVQRTGGHTPYHQMVWLESRGRRAAYVADLMPTTAHVREAWIASFDLQPADTLAAKKALLQEVASRETLILFDHDPRIAAGYIEMADGEPVVRPA